MASNRYTQLSFNSLNDLPQLQLPYEKLDNLLGQQQSKIDLLNGLADLTPKFIQQSEDDRSLAGRIMKYQQDVKAQLAEIAKTGNVNAYMNGLSQAQNQIKKLYSPGGPADVLQQRYNQDIEEKKRLAEFYKDKPDWANYELANRKYNKVGYNSQTGEYNPVNTFGNITKYISSKEIDEWANRNLDNIKDSLLEDASLSGKVTRKDLDGITSVYDFWQLKGVPYEKIAKALGNTIPKEYIQSMYHDYNVQRYYNPSLPELDTNLTVRDKDGKEQLNTNNPVGRLLHGYAIEGQRKNLEHDRIKDDNEVKLLKIKDQIENPFIPPTSGYTEAVTNPYLSDVDKIVIKDGKIKAQTQYGTTEATVPTTTSGSGFSTFGAEKRTIGTGQPREITGKETELLNKIKTRYKTQFGKEMSDKQLESAYNNMIEQRKSSAIIFERINDPKQLKNLNDRVLGSEKKILNIGVRPVYFLDSDGNISRPMTAQDAINKLGTENLDKGIEGKISADNPIGLPTGDYATAIDKNGKFVTMIIGNRSIEEDSHFAPLSKLSKPKYSLESETIKIGNTTYVSEPIIDIDEEGNYKGVDVKITKYDAYGKEIGEMSLPQAEQYFKVTNPYK